MINKNILIKVADVEHNIFTGQRIFKPTFEKEKDPIVYSEFEKILNDKNVLGELVGDEYWSELYIGDTISKIEVGNSFSIYNEKLSAPLFLKSNGGRITSPIIKIFTPNLFLTHNSLYFIKDESYQISLNREQKLKQIL